MYLKQYENIRELVHSYIYKKDIGIVFIECITVYL